MSEYTALFERAAARYDGTPLSTDALLLRRDRKRRDRRIRAGVVGLVIAIAVGWWGLHAIRSTPLPAEPPEEHSTGLGIFEPVAGRIVFQNGTDRRYDAGLWAVDPNSPSVSSLVRLGGKGSIPLGWSSDGTQLLVMREDHDTPFPYKDALFVLHADGSETLLNENAMYTEGASISPDGSRVIFAAAGGAYFPYNDPSAEPGLFVVDTAGGQPVPIPYPAIGDPVSSPTFSPDGTQIAYLLRRLSDDDIEVWVADADGSDAHEILADEPAVAAGVGKLSWSPAGDRIVMDNALGRVLEIYTFAPDGSEFETVITGGMNPVWSPDGSQIAYMLPYDGPPGAGPPGLAIADADGSNVREFGLAMSGPWHPGQVAPTQP